MDLGQLTPKRELTVSKTWNEKADSLTKELLLHAQRIELKPVNFGSSRERRLGHGGQLYGDVLLTLDPLCENTYNVLMRFQKYLEPIWQSNNTKTVTFSLRELLINSQFCIDIESEAHVNQASIWDTVKVSWKFFDTFVKRKITRSQC